MLYWYSIILFVLHLVLILGNVLSSKHEDASIGFLSILIYLPLLGRVLGWW